MPVDRIRTLVDELKQAAYSLSQVAYQQTGPDAGTNTGNYGDPPRSRGDDDVVDADFEERPNA